MCTTAKTEIESAFAHASCRIAPFRRYRVSEVCHGGGFLLAFAASLAMDDNLSRRIAAVKEWNSKRTRVRIEAALVSLNGHMRIRR
jgi:hypothetical protein